MTEEVTITIDTELLEQFSAVCAELGVTVEETIVAFFEAVARDESILEKLIAEEKRNTLIFQSALSVEEIDANFEGVNVGDGIIAALGEVLVYE